MISNESIGDQGLPFGAGSGAPSLVNSIAGYDGANTQVIHTDTNGNTYILGTLTSNTAAPAANTLLGSLVAVAGAAAPSYTGGNLVPLSVDLSGNLRTASTLTLQTLGAALPSTGLTVGAQVVTTVPTYTAGNLQALTMDAQGNLKVTGGWSGTVNASWTSGTGTGTTLTLTNQFQYAGTMVQVNYSGSVTGGQAILEGSMDGVNFVPVDFVAVNSGTITNTLFFSGGTTSTAWQMYTAGFTTVRVRLTVAITGAGTVSLYMVGTTVGAEGAVNIDSASGILVYGALSHNNAAPVGGQLGVLPAVASTAAPSYATGNQVLLSCDTSGNLRSINTCCIAANTAAGSTMVSYSGGLVSAGAPSYTAGNISPLSLDTAGNLRVLTSGSTAPADAFANPTTALTDFSLLGGYNGTTWDRVRALANNADTVAVSTLGNLSTLGYNYVYNGASWDRVRGTAAQGTASYLQDVTTSGTLGSLNAAVTVSAQGALSVGFQITAGLTGTITAEASFDGGTTWVQAYIDNITKLTTIVNPTANSYTIVGAGGASNYRIRVSAYTSGSATCSMRANNVSDPAVLYGTAPNTALPPATAMMGGSVTTAIPSYTTATGNFLSMDTSGLLRILNYGYTTGAGTTASLFTVKAASTLVADTDTAVSMQAHPRTGGGALAAAIPSGALLIGTQATNATQTYTAGNMQTPTMELSGNLRVVLKPIDVGALGAYRIATTSGTMAAGLSANSAVWAFRTGATNPCLVRRLTLSMWNAGTAFTAGRGNFNVFVGRSFSASYSAGGTAATLTGNNNKKKTAFATTSIAQIYTASTGAISGATVTLDANPITAVTYQVTATASQVMLQTIDLLDLTGSEPSWPLVLAANEGIVIQATVPATGTWSFQVNVAWEEVVTAP